MEKVWIKGFIRDVGLRRQPWTTAEHDESHKYYDFKRNPDLIPDVLEDYKPWAERRSIQKFYDLVRWVNGDNSPFESNDCAFHGPKPNSQKDRFPKEQVCSGRLMFFFRDPTLNLSDDSIQVASIYKGEKEVPPFSISPHLQALAKTSLQLLLDIRPEFQWGSIAIEAHPVVYDEAPFAYENRFGYELSFHFWAWGTHPMRLLKTSASSSML